MPNISQINVDGVDYDIKDNDAQRKISSPDGSTLKLLLHGNETYFVEKMTMPKFTSRVDNDIIEISKPIIAYGTCTVQKSGNDVYILGGIEDSASYDKVCTSMTGLEAKQRFNWLPYPYPSGTQLPYTLGMYGQAVYYDGTIHILGGDTSPYTQHYKLSNGKWVEVSTLPYPFKGGVALVWDDGIHIMGHDGFDYGGQHWLFDGTSWTQLANVPYRLQGGGRGCIHNGKIHVMGGLSPQQLHYEWSGTQWVRMEDLPYGFYSGGVCSINNELHLFGGSVQRRYHYKHDGTQWVRMEDLPIDFVRGNVITSVYGEIHLFGGRPTVEEGGSNHYIINADITEINDDKTYIGTLVVEK